MVHIGRIARLFVCAWFLTALSSHAAMTQLSANTGEVSDFAVVSNQVVFAATQGGGLYKSTNQGSNWARVTTLPAQYINKVAGRDGQAPGAEVVYAATSVGVFRTSNGGTTWTQIYPSEAISISVAPASNDFVLIGVKGVGILRTISGTTTATWTLGTGYDSTEVTAIVHDSTSTTAYAAFYSNVVANWGGVYKSTDSGATWAAANYNLDNPHKFVRQLAVDNSNNVYAAMDFQIGAGGGIWRLNAGAGSWTQVNTKDPGNGQTPYRDFVMKSVHHDRGTPGRMWASTGPFASGFWRADDAQTSNTSLLNTGFAYAVFDQTKFTVSNAFATFTGSPGVLLIAINGLGVYKSTNSGAPLPTVAYEIPLNPSNTGLTADRVAAFAVSPSTPTTIYMGLIGGGVFKSVNSGTAWNAFNTGFESILNGPSPGAGLTPQNDKIFTTTHIAVSPTDANDVWAGQLGRGLFRSTNGGAAWAPINESGLANNPVNPSRNIRPRTLVNAGGGIVFYSVFDMPDTDGNPATDQAGFYRRSGTTWTRVVTPPFVGNSGAGKLLITPSRYIALVNDTMPYISADGVGFGQILSAQTTPPGNSVPDIGFSSLYFYDMTFKPGTPTTLVAASNKGLYRSTDNLVTFAPVSVSGPLTFTTFTAVGYSSAGTLFAGTPDGKIFCSTNDGTAFVAKNLPATWGGSQVKSIVLTGTTVYFLTDGNGVWQESSPTCP